MAHDVSDWSGFGHIGAGRRRATFFHGGEGGCAVRLSTLLLVGGFIAAVTLLTLLAYARLAPLRSPYELVSQPGVVVVDSHGVVLQRDMRDGLRVPVTLQDVSPAMVDATIAAEDA